MSRLSIEEADRRMDGRIEAEEGGKAKSVKCDACGDVGDGAEKVFPAAEQQEDSLETELFECNTTPSLPPVLSVCVCVCLCEGEDRKSVCPDSQSEKRTQAR